MFLKFKIAPKLTALVLIAIFLVVVVYTLQNNSHVSATANQEINFQGKIVNSTNGTNLSAGSPSCIKSGADTCDFRVSIFSDPSGGTALWTEVFTDIEIGSYDGIFNLSIGSYCITNQAGTWTTDGDGGGSRCSVSGGGVDWGNDPTLYLQVEFDTTDTAGLNAFSSPETFSRKLLTSVPYAFYSDKAAVSENVINNSGVINFNDVNTGDIPFSDGTFNSLPGGYSSILHALNAASGGGGGLWTINGNVTYLTSSGSDLSLSATLASAFSVDKSENLVRIGDGSSGNGKIDFFSSTGDTARLEYKIDVLELSGGDFRIVDNTSLIFGNDNDIRFEYDEITDDRLEITDGTNTLIAITDAGTTGNLFISGFLSIGTGTNNQLRISAGAGTATNTLYWGNQSVCLQNGSGCSVNSTLWEQLTFNSGSNTATFENDYDVIVGNWSGDNTPLTNTGFVLDSASGDDLFVLDLLGVGDTIYVQDSIVVGTGGVTSNTNSNLILSGNGTGVVQSNDNLEITTGFLTSTSTLTFNDVNTGDIALSDGSNTTLPGGATSILDALNNLANGTGGLWTAGAGTTYLTSTTDDFAIGGSTIGASTFSIDVSANDFRFGTGATSNAKLNFYADDGDTGLLTYNNNDSWEFSGGAVNMFGGDLLVQSTTPNNIIIDNSTVGSDANSGLLVLRGNDRTSFTDTQIDFNLRTTISTTSDYRLSFMNNSATTEVGSIDESGNLQVDGYINIGTNAADLLSVVSQSIANSDLYYGNDLLCDISEVDCGWVKISSGASSKWTDSGAITYLTETTDDLAVGGTNTSSPFFFDVSTGQLTLNTTGSTGGLVLGNDTSIYDGGTNILRTDDDFLVGLQRNVIIDNVVAGATSDSGAAIFRGNYFNVTNTQIDFRVLLDVVSNTDYRLSFLNNTAALEVASLDESGNYMIEGFLNLGNASANDILRVGAGSTGASADLYWGDDLVCDVSEINCGWSAGGGSLFTENGNVINPINNTRDFAIGGTTLAAAFSVDTDQNTVRIGVGSGTNSVLGMYASDGDTGNITYTTNDRWEFAGGGILLADDFSLNLGTDADFFLRYDELTDDRLEFGFGANQFGFINDVASQTYGDFQFTGTTVLGTGLASNQTALYINPSTGYTGKLLDLDIAGVDIFEVSFSGIRANVPATFAAAGNVQIANNLVFTNNTSSFIRSDSPLYIVAGDMVSDEDLILSANNNGYVIVDDRLDVTDKIQLGTGLNNFLATTSQVSTPTNNLYWGNKLVCDVSFSTCSLISDGGSVSYLTSTTDDFALGGTTLSSAFSVDVSDELTRIGSGTGVGGKLDIYSSNGNSVRFEMSTTDVLRLNNGGFNFNQASEAVDFLISGDNDANLFVADGSADRIGIGEATPASKLEVQLTSASEIGIIIQGASSQTGNLLEFRDNSNNILAFINSNGGAVFNEFGLNTDFRVEGDTIANLFFIDASTDRIGIGTDTPGVKLDIDGGLALRAPSEITLTADDQVVNVADRSYIKLTSDNTTPTSRTFTISNPQTAGQILVIEFNAVTCNASELLNTGNVVLQGNLSTSWTNHAGRYTITLIASTTSQWSEISRNVYSPSTGSTCP